MTKPASQARTSRLRGLLGVSVVNHCRGLRADRKLLIRAARLVTREHGIGGGQVELVIFSDVDMARLHKEYLGRRKVTDVICFDLGRGESEAWAQPPRFQVSLALGGELARRQARKHRTSINKELALYTVHGLLHALGYGDSKPRNARAMHEREDELLTRLGLGCVFNKKAVRR